MASGTEVTASTLFDEATTLEDHGNVSPAETKDTDRTPAVTPR